jgi:hypothetical protein
MEGNVIRMPYLAAAVAVVGVLCLFDLILTVAVIRKLRDHSARLSRVTLPATLLPAGTEVAEVATVDRYGEAIDGAWLRNGMKLVIFMSATCSACIDQLPDAAARAGGFPGGPDSILTAVVGADGNSAEIVSAFDGIARLVQGAQVDSVVSAFQVSAYPSYFVLDNGRIEVATHSAPAIDIMAVSSKLAMT